MTSSTIEQKVEVSEAIRVQVASDLVKRGYFLGDKGGWREDGIDSDAIGIQKFKGNVRGGLLGLFNVPTYDFIGVLFLDDESKKTALNKNWLLEVYGRDNLQELGEVAKYLANQYSVPIKVSLESEQPKRDLTGGDPC